MRRTDPEREILVKKRQSHTGKYVTVIILGLIALSITFIALYAQQISRGDNTDEVDKSIKICITPSCVSAAEHLNKAMNRNINPCDDFYEFACGGWNRTEPMPDDKATWSVFDILDRELLRNLKTILITDEVVIPGGLEATATEKMQAYFKSCINEEAIETAGIRDLEGHLKAAYNSGLEAWPFFLSPPLTLDISKVVRTAFEFGNNLDLFSYYITGGPLTPKINVINFDTARFTLDRFSLLNESRQASREAYVQYGVDVAMHLAADQNRTDVTLEGVTALFQRILAFEMELANATLPPEDTRDATEFQNEMSLSSFAGNYTRSLGLTGEKWAEIFANAWPDAASNLTANTIVNVRETKYFAKLNSYFTGATPDRMNVLSNFLAWKVLEPLVVRLGSKYRSAYQKFAAVVSGTTMESPRLETCVLVLNNQFPNAIGSLYVRNFFRKEAKAELENMVRYLILSFREIVKSSYWMGEKTRQTALEKAEKIVANLAYTSYMMDNVTAVNDEHRTFLAGNSFLLNYLNGRKFAAQVQGRRYANANQPTDWVTRNFIETGPAVINAFYSNTRNSITFPAGILQAPFMGSGYPYYWNFAAIGTVIGHEITHLFDDQGAQADGEGRLINWWDPQSKKAFEERAKTIIDQYSGYNLLGVQLKGANSQGENIADNGGLKESYGAYRMYRKQHLNDTEEPRLPGFETLNSDQMFYLSYAQVWCGDYRKQEVELQVNRPHSPGRFRIIGPLQNSPQFSHAYRCPQGSYMNPIKKAAVW
ncbi:Neprilysin-11 [Hypsibius exemplaris]|uniref:Neprilysin-11 n=1 Tax=Hypsibius exemplaris TaxID=2072580 RepID=A0A1W0WRY1_HYPEX|nr:Neprilysin-11 [Hypsibius exemplaris]